MIWVMSRYGQYCPITRSLEILGDRWTLLIVRDLLVGARRFNEISRGLPGMSRPSCPSASTSSSAPAWCSRTDEGYEPTQACQELRPIIFGLAEWGARWAFGKPREDELDPTVLMWWIRGGIDPEPFGERRVVLHVLLPEGRRTRFWFVIDPHDVSLCFTDPGHEVDLLLESDARHALPDVGGRLRAAQRHARRPDPADRTPRPGAGLPRGAEVLPRGALRPSSPGAAHRCVTYATGHSVPRWPCGGLGWLPFLWRPLSPDEGGFLIVASQWGPGSSLYGDYWVDRPPVLIGLFALADGVGDPWALRVLGCSPWSPPCPARRARRPAGRARRPGSAWSWPPATAAIFTATPLFGGSVVNSELLALPFILAGLAAAIAASSARSAGATLALGRRWPGSRAPSPRSPSRASSTSSWSRSSWRC